MAAANLPGPTSDTALIISGLFDEITENPPAIGARKLLVEQYLEIGWRDAACEFIRELQKLAPNDSDVKLWFLAYCPNDDIQQSSIPAPVASQESQLFVPSLPADLDSVQLELHHGYEMLRTRAKTLHREARLLRNMLQQRGTPSAAAHFDKHIPDLAALADGRVATVVQVRPPGSARATARAMEANPDRALDIAVTDLADMARWLRSPQSRPSQPSQPSLLGDTDSEVREAIAKRVRALVAALPENMKHHASSAQMHIEHEVLRRAYICDETMIGDSIADVPRERFWVSEDGYAWDMEELAQALASNGGVMRNPLSRQMFTTQDIHAIIRHPLGKRLGALQIEQGMLSQGLRPNTIKQLDELGTVLLADMSTDQIPSRHAVDEFLAYVATLPQAEQKAVDTLRVPARDSHTSQPFDTSIGEAVRDAQGNKVCFHKTGDFLKQAAQHLRRGG
jgi:hypothetical protein